MTEWPRSPTTGGHGLVGGHRRTVTVTFGYGGELRTLVAVTLKMALAKALHRWGEWTTIEAISTADSILADVQGRTKAYQQPGINDSGSRQTELSKLRSIGYEPRPGELGSHVYARTMRD